MKKTLVSVLMLSMLSLSVMATSLQVGDTGWGYTLISELELIEDNINSSLVSIGSINTEISDLNTSLQTVLGWGNHSSEGYLKSFIESDPIFTNHIANGLTNSDMINWNASFSWGNHATESYLKSLPLQSSQDLQVNGTLITYKDQATSLRLAGLDYNGNYVQTYSGIFYNNAYDSVGTKKTRVIHGTNLDVDFEIQSSNSINIVARDNNNDNEQVVTIAGDTIRFFADTVGADTSEVVPSSYVQIKNDGEISTNSGDLTLNPSGDVVIKNGFTGSCGASTTLTVVNGVITACS